MHVQQQYLSLCNSAIVGNHHDTSNKLKNIQRSNMLKLSKLIGQNHKFQYHVLAGSIK
jgi:hypothetical protein